MNQCSGTWHCTCDLCAQCVQLSTSLFASASLQWPISGMDTEESENLCRIASVIEGESASQSMGS